MLVIPVMLVMSETHGMPVLDAGVVTDPYSPIPLYKQIADILAAQITDGTYGPEDRLPSETRIGQEYGVSRLTARSVHRELARRGLAVVVQGRGTFVPPE